MSFTDLTCFAGELCLYMSTLGFVVSLCGETRSGWVYIVLGLIAGAGCMLAQRAKGALRFLPLLLFAPAFLLARSVAAVVLPVPMLLLMAMRTRYRAWQSDYELVRKLFKAGIGVYALLLGLMALAEVFGRFLGDTLPLFVVWLLLTVLDLRLLRNSDLAGFGGRFKLLNAALVLGVALIGFLLSSDLAVTAFLAAVGAVYSYVIAPILFVVLSIIVVLPAVLAYLFGLLVQLFRSDVEPTEIDMSGFGIEFSDYDGSTMESSVWFQRAAVAIAVILFLLIAFFVARKLISGKTPTAQMTRTLERESVAVKQEKRRRRLGDSPRERVRLAYRKYLALCGGLGIPVDGSVASDVIRNSSAPYTGEEDAETLRDQWLRARFSTQEITDADAKEARQLTRRMRGSAEQVKKAEKSGKAK